MGVLASIKPMSRETVESIVDNAANRGRILGVRMVVTDEEDDEPWTAPPLAKWRTSHQRPLPSKNLFGPRQPDLYCQGGASSRSAKPLDKVSPHFKIPNSTRNKQCVFPSTIFQGSYVAGGRFPQSHWHFLEAPWMMWFISCNHWK